jgi:CubicO group peptidase (beta-lactamase class C family)
VNRLSALYERLEDGSFRRFDGMAGQAYALQDWPQASGAVGQFFWDGAANTLFWVDPKNQLTAVLFNIYRPFGFTQIQKDFRDAVYQDHPQASALTPR